MRRRSSTSNRNQAPSLGCGARRGQAGPSLTARRSVFVPSCTPVSYWISSIVWAQLIPWHENCGLDGRPAAPGAAGTELTSLQVGLGSGSGLEGDCVAERFELMDVVALALAAFRVDA